MTFSAFVGRLIGGEIIKTKGDYDENQTLQSKEWRGL